MSYCHLTQYDRYLIWLGISLNKSICCIAAVLRMHRSTIYREIRRNSNSPSGSYQHSKANRISRARRKSAGFTQTKITGDLKDFVINGLRKEWSPEQIAGRAKLEGKFSLCHETIYTFLYRDQQLGGEHWKLLKRSKSYRRRRFGYYKRGYPIPGIIRIEKRSKKASGRKRIGDFERDLIIGKKGTKPALLTIVDRKSRYLRIKKVRSKSANEIHQLTLNALKSENYVHTITNDNGFEFAEFAKTEKALKAKIFFTNPYSSWERGSIENANGLIRAYFKTGTNFEEISHAQIKKIETKLNNRPRKTLGYRTPKEAHFENAY